MAGVVLAYGCGMTMNTSPVGPHSTANAGCADGPAGADGTASASAARPLPVILAREAGLVVAGAVALALIGQISLPLPFTPVPVTLGTLAALGVGGLLGGRRALGSVSLYAAAAPAAVIAGRALARTADGARRPLPVRIGLMLIASAVVYVPGLMWLKVATGIAWKTTLAAGLAPFVIGDALKSVVVALLPSRR